MKLFTHLNFGGNCQEAFRFYEKHIGGEITTIVPWSQMPQTYQAPPGFENAVVHARLSIAGVELIGNDVPREHFQPIRSSYIYLAVDSAEEAERIWGVLADGGQVGMPLAETFFASRFGQLRDRFGVLWSIIHERGR
jgi:PhnB protein